MPQQIVIDSLEFAQGGRELSGELALADMSRVATGLLSCEGLLSYRLTGELGARGEPLLRLELSGSLPVQCQRCLERLDSPLDVDVLYELRSGGELTQDDLEDDSRDFLPLDRAMDVVALIEDEVILALPVAPRHGNCSPPVMRRDDGIVTPFSVLKSLGKKSQ